MRFVFVIVALPLACATPRVAPVPVPALPFATDTLRSRLVRPGVTHWFVYAPAGPWAIHALAVDRDACYSALAVKGFAGAEGREKTSTLLARLDDTVDVVGGVNGDFFAPSGVPTNAHVARGRALTPPSTRPVLTFDSAGAPRITTFVAGAAVGDTVLEAVGGRPALARDSGIVSAVDTEGGPGFATGRHPRTAVGIARGGKWLLLAVVDGRQKPYSDGMTLRELATLMLALGARDAINLDGGGSTTLVVADSAGALRVANRPSDATGERAVGNALAIVRACRRG